MATNTPNTYVDLRVAGVNEANIPLKDIADEWISDVRKAISIDDGEWLKALLILLDTRDNKGSYSIPPITLQYIIREMGGDETFKELMEEKLPPGAQYLERQIRRRANNGQYLPEDYAELDEARRTIETQRQIAQKIVIPLAKTVSGVYVQELLELVKSEISEFANNLADCGHPFAATVVQSLGDILVPGSLPEIALELVPIKIHFVWASAYANVAKRSPRIARSCEKIAQALQKNVTPEINQTQNITKNVTKTQMISGIKIRFIPLIQWLMMAKKKV